VNGLATDLLANVERLAHEGPFVRARDAASTAPSVLRCVGCSEYHGSVGGELACLREAIRRLRETRFARRGRAPSLRLTKGEP
jgi:hypothetical protein